MSALKEIKENTSEVDIMDLLNERTPDPRDLYEEDELPCKEEKQEPAPEALEELGEGSALTEIEDDDRFDPDDVLGRYFGEAGRTKLLTQEEEIDLSIKIQNGRDARERLSKGNIRKETERESLVSAVRIGTEAFQTLINSNYGLVIFVAKWYIGRGVLFKDLIQEGNLGLIRAAKRFDSRKGYKFSIYAVWWIRQAITRGIADSGRTIRIPVHRFGEINRMFWAEEKLRMKLGHNPTKEELAEYLGISVDKLKFLKEIAQFTYSLDKPMDSEGGNNSKDFSDYIPDESPSIESKVMDDDRRKEIQALLDKLPPREAKVLSLRYGLGGGVCLTLNEIGEKLGITRERVRQLEQKALARLGNRLNKAKT